MNSMPKRIKYEINSLSPSQFCSGNKIGITRNQHDLINLPLVTQRSNVQTDAHIDALLDRCILKIFIGQRCKIKAVSKQLLQFAFF